MADDIFSVHVPDPEALPPDLQAAVEAARNVPPRSWTNFDPETLVGLVAHATGDPDWVAPEPEVVTDEDLAAIEEEL